MFRTHAGEAEPFSRLIHVESDKHDFTIAAVAKTIDNKKVFTLNESVCTLMLCCKPQKKKRKRISTSAAFVTTEFKVSSSSPPRCITSANQTRERVQNTRLFALTLSIYYGYIVQANSLRANRHIVLNTETEDTFLY